MRCSVVKRRSLAALEAFETVHSSDTQMNQNIGQSRHCRLVSVLKTVSRLDSVKRFTTAVKRLF